MSYLVIIGIVLVAIVVVLAYFIVRVWVNSVPKTTSKLTKKVIEDYDKFPVWGMEKYNQLNGGATPYNGPMPGKATIGTPKILSGFPIEPLTDGEIIVSNPVIDVNSNLYFATYDSSIRQSKIYGYDVTGNFELQGFPLVLPGVVISNPLVISSDNNLFYVDNLNIIHILNLSDINGTTGYNNFPLTMNVQIAKLVVSSSGRITFYDKIGEQVFYLVDKNANVQPAHILDNILDYAVDENDDIYIALAGGLFYLNENTFWSLPYPLGTTSVASIAIGNDGNIYYAYGTQFLYGVGKKFNGLIKKFPFMALDPIVRVNTGANNIIYATDDANRIYAVNSDGSFAWAEDMGNNLNKIYPTGNGNLFYLANDGTDVLVYGYNNTGQLLNRYPLRLNNKQKVAVGLDDGLDYIAVGKNSTIYFTLVDLDDNNKTKMYAIY